ncbi:hypothetical protein [Polaribacter sp.]|uniref:hypothetical protein n=1 Tax=Polaribacter sp. TaxID=1920175 RepID=UPI003F6D799A
MNNLKVLELHQEIKSSADNEIKDIKKELDNSMFDDEIVSQIEGLRSLGFRNFDYSRVLRDLENKKKKRKTLKTLKKDFSGYDILTEETIFDICKKYNLKFDYIKNYTAEVPFKVLDKFKKLNKFISKNKLDYNLKELHIIAPESKFDPKAKNFKKEDPILIARIHYMGFYVVIHSWGYEKEILKNLK